MIWSDEIIRARGSRIFSPFAPHRVTLADVNGDGEIVKVMSYGTQPVGYDLRASETLAYFDSRNHRGVIDPKNFNEEVLSYMKAWEQPDGLLVLPPRAHGLMQSKEYITMPADAYAFCMGKSSYARCGLLVNHVTGLIPGWQGHLVIELANVTDNPIIIYPNEGIGTLIFADTHPVSATYAEINGAYQGQEGITLPK